MISPSPFATDNFEARSGGTSAHPLIRIRGTLDVGSIRPVLQLVRKIDLRSAQTLTIDLEGVTFIDAAGVRVLTTARQRTRALGCALVVSNPSRPVRRLLSLCGLEKLFDLETGASYAMIYPDVA